MPLPSDLALASTQELVMELSKRFDASFFTGVDFDEEIHTYLHGSALLCSGLAQNVQNEIQWLSFKDRLSK